VAGVEPHARVALLLGKVEMALEHADTVELAGHVGGLGLDLLHAHTIGPARQPGFERPCVAAERMPLRLRLVSLNKEAPW
jgi:hypothetical protein